MLTLTYGFQKPQSNDRGPVVFPALEANWQQVNDHTHDGSNSAPILSSSISKTTQTLVSGDWTLVSGGHYTQTKNLPGALQYDGVTLTFHHAVTGDLVYPTVTKVSATQYAVGWDDPSVGLLVLIN